MRFSYGDRVRPNDHYRTTFPTTTVASGMVIGHLRGFGPQVPQVRWDTQQVEALHEDYLETVQ